MLWLLLATLALSAGLNFYLLAQEPGPLITYELDDELLESATELELQQVRRALSACQAAHAPPDTSAHSASALAAE
jgi:hypothetical protein